MIPGCDDPKCCPQAERRPTKEERKLNKRLAFIESVAEMYFVAGHKLTEAHIPRSFEELPEGKHRFINVYVTSYGPIELKQCYGPPWFVYEAMA